MLLLFNCAIFLFYFVSYFPHFCSYVYYFIKFDTLKAQKCIIFIQMISVQMSLIDRKGAAIAVLCCG